MKIYLAGPMTGIPSYNFPGFHAAARELRAAGHEVFNPAEHDTSNGFDAIAVDSDGTDAESHGFDLRATLKADLSWICDHADGVALLEGWRASKGVAAEVALAAALQIPRVYWREYLTTDGASS